MGTIGDLPLLTPLYGTGLKISLSQGKNVRVKNQRAEEQISVVLCRAKPAVIYQEKSKF